MAAYSALLVDASTVGLVFTSGLEDATTKPRRNTPEGVQRIPVIVAPHIVQEALGGMLSADFQIPPEYAATAQAALKAVSYVWLFDGLTPIFYGVTDSFVRDPQTGMWTVQAAGMWQLLSRTRMREAWDLWDHSQLVQSPGGAINKSGGSASLDSNNNVVLTFPKGANIASGDYVGMDYWLFDEPVGPRDQKLITAFDIDATSATTYSGQANLEFRVYGMATPGDSSGSWDLLLQSTNATPSTIGRASGWPNTNGYRLLRFMLRATGTITNMSQDRNVVLDRVRISTRTAYFPALASPFDTTTFVIDAISQRQNTNLDVLDIPQEFWRTHQAFGSDPVTGQIGDSNVPINGQAFTDWTSPAEILGAFAAIDGFKCGTYLPRNPRTGWDWNDNQSGQSAWMTQPPALAYKAWSDLTLPDLVAHQNKGAVFDPDPSAQTVLDEMYVNYSNSAGFTKSVYVSDTSSANWLWSQGVRRAEDYTIGPATGDAAASSLGSQMLATRRATASIGLITIMGNQPGSLVSSHGAVIGRLSSVRPGVVGIRDTRVKANLRSGYATHVEWWGSVMGQPERLELTLTRPGEMRIERTLAAMARAANNKRTR